MKVRKFPLCCNAVVISDFSGTDCTESDIQINPSVKEIKEELLFQRKSGMSLVVAILNDQQETARETLIEAGFKCSDEITKAKHPNTTVRLYYYELDKIELDVNDFLGVFSNSLKIQLKERGKKLPNINY